MLITEIQEVQVYASVSADLDMMALTPHLRRAEKRFLKPYIGMEFLNELQEGYNLRGWNEDMEKVHDLACAVLVPASLYYYINVGGASIDNSGIYYPKNGERWNLSESERAKLADKYLEEALDNLDELLNYLETGNFNYYQNSLERKKERESLVNTAGIIRDVFEVIHPRVVFRAMREAIRYEEEARVKPILQEYYDTLMAICTPSGDDAELLDIARQAIVYLAMSRALLTRTVKLTGEGIEVIIGERTQIGTGENARIEAAAREYLKSGEERIETLVEELERILPTGYTPKEQPAIDRVCKKNKTNKIAFF